METQPATSPKNGRPTVYCAKCHLATPKHNERCIHCGQKLCLLEEPMNHRNKQSGI